MTAMADQSCGKLAKNVTEFPLCRGTCLWHYIAHTALT